MQWVLDQHTYMIRIRVVFSLASLHKPCSCCHHCQIIATKDRKVSYSITVLEAEMTIVLSSRTTDIVGLELVT
jgi:predicted transcriptional regulator